jgi:hypothetical protein
LSDFQTALKDELQEELDSFATTTLSEASTTSLLCEVLPLLVKSHHAIPALHGAVRELVEMPWRAHELSLDIEMSDEELESMAQDVTILEEEAAMPLETKDSVAKARKRGEGAPQRFGTAATNGDGISEDKVGEEEDDEIEEWE